MVAGPSIRLGDDPLPKVAPASHLYLAVPAYTGEISVQTAHSLIAAAAALTAAGVMVTTDFVAGCCYLDQVRNILAANFLASEATDLLFIDADVGFDADAALKLALTTRPVVAGVYPKKVPPRKGTEAPEEYPVDFENDQLMIDEDGLIEAAHVATGFLKINRGVFEKISRVVPEYLHKDSGRERMLKRFFRCDVRDGVYWGEDFQFCQDWLALGGRIFITPEIDFQHVGPHVWRGNWGNWVRSEAVQAAAKEEAA
jgi:hypothetical protein